MWNSEPEDRVYIFAADWQWKPYECCSIGGIIIICKNQGCHTFWDDISPGGPCRGVSLSRAKWAAGKAGRLQWSTIQWSTGSALHSALCSELNTVQFSALYCIVQCSVQILWSVAGRWGVPGASSVGGDPYCQRPAPPFCTGIVKYRRYNALYRNKPTYVTTCTSLHQYSPAHQHTFFSSS